MTYRTLLLISAMLATETLAADTRVNEFMRRDGGLVCVTDTFNANEPATYLPCLRIGSIHIGQSEKDVERLLGNPWKVIRDGATTVKVFPIESDERSKPYWVISFKAGTAESVQLTGKNPKVAGSFSSIRLGDTKTKVLEVLGEPFATKPVEDIQGILWSYRPFPISIEIVDGTVYSIRVSRRYP